MPGNYPIFTPAGVASSLALALEVFALWGAGKKVVLDNSGITVDGEKWTPSNTKQISIPVQAGQTGMFRIEGKICKITYEGKEVCLPVCKGLRYIHYLIQHPWEDVHCSQLVAMLNGEAPVIGDDETNEALLNGTLTVEEERHEQVVTPGRRKQLENHLKKLNEDLAERKAVGEPTDVVESEIEQFEQNLKKIGYGKHAAKIPTQSDLDRRSVAKVIKFAIKSVEALNPTLGYFFSKSFKYGVFILYNPIKEVHWEK
jgi:hypothetical protein